MNRDLKVHVGEIIPFIQNGDYFFNKGLKAYRHRDLQKAEKHLNRAIQYDPNESVYHCQIAIVLTELGEYKRSNKHLKLIIEKLDEDLIDCYYFIANNYAHLGLFQEAKKFAYKYQEQAPDGEYIEETEDLLDLMNIELDDVLDEIMNDDDELIVKQEKACKLLEDGELEEAVTILEHLVKNYPEFWSAYNNLAMAHFYLGQKEKAFSLIDEVMNKNKGNLNALCNLAIFYHYDHEDDKVEKIIEQLKKVFPIDLDHRYRLGTTFAMLGKFHEAFHWLRWLQKNFYDGDNAFYYWLAVSAYELGYETLALDTWETVVEMNPSKKGEEPWNRD